MKLFEKLKEKIFIKILKSVQKKITFEVPENVSNKSNCILFQLKTFIFENKIELRSRDLREHDEKE